MAESAVFSLACKIMSTIASPAFEKAYEKGLSIWEARDELAKLRVTIETIQAVLLDAEKKQQGSVAIKSWIKRLKGVLYDAEDLFDEVATDDLLKQQINKCFLRKVRVSCSKLNPIVSRNSIAKKVKDIRESLLGISTDMAGLGFVSGQHEEAISSMRVGQDPGSFVDPKYVFGRDGDKKAILDMLFNESNDARFDAPVVIAIVGIGGMGKTTLAQLVYNDDEVKKNFGNRWFACISDTSDDKEVLGKIFQSVCGGSYSNFSIGQLQTKIRESIEGKKFLLVLDDVWDEDHAQWQHRLSLLGGGEKGSKIIVTTRSSSVAKAVDAFETHTLCGLSEEDSWDLFKRVAFTPERENDRRWTDVGKEIVKKCARVPLAIRSIGSLLYTKTTIREWEFIKDQELSKIEERGSQDQIMSVLKLSYHHLPSSMKHCFAYCSLFPKDYVFDVRKLIYLWIAQGYVRPKEDGESVEEIGHSYFMSLLRRSFFQEAEEELGEIMRCKMHDLVHDLAQHVAGEEIVMLTKPFSQYHSARHVHIGCGPDNIGEILPQVHNTTKLRSFVLMTKGWDVGQQLRGYKWLRALRLSKMGFVGFVDVPSCIGELKLLRYLDLSGNHFERLPDSVTNLLNLLALDLENCFELKALPDNFRKLINLRCLNIRRCDELKHMPPGFGELSSLQYLSHFKVGKVVTGVKTKRSGLDALSGLQQLRGELNIVFDSGLEEEDWDGDECWKLPIGRIITRACIYSYPGMRLPRWANNGPSLLPNFVEIRLGWCYKVKYLPPLRCLPYLKSLRLDVFHELEYIEEEEQEGDMHSSSFFPCLKDLTLSGMPKLKGWSRRMSNHLDHVAVELETSTTHPPPMQQQLLSFPLLSRLFIIECLELKYMPLCPRLWGLYLNSVDGVVTKQLLSSSASAHCPSQWIYITRCSELTSVEVEAPLYSFEISSCYQLKNLRIAHPNVLEELKISDCTELVLSTGVDWDSLPNLRTLRLGPLPPLEELPQCLVQRQALGELEITERIWHYNRTM